MGLVTLIKYDKVNILKNIVLAIKEDDLFLLFNGYLPIEPNERAKAIRLLEQRAYSEDTTQIFIEAPYRNGKLIADLTKTCRPQTKLCIASAITCEEEMIVTKPIKEWSKHIPEVGKIPAIYLIYKG